MKRSALCGGGFHQLCYDRYVPRPAVDPRFPAAAACYCSCGHPEPERDWARIRRLEAELRAEGEKYDFELARRDCADQAAAGETETIVAYVTAPVGRRSGPPDSLILHDGTVLTRVVPGPSMQLRQYCWILHNGLPLQVQDMRTKPGGGHVLQLSNGHLLSVEQFDQLAVFTPEHPVQRASADAPAGSSQPPDQSQRPPRTAAPDRSAAA